jgi:hypothetical protein
MDDGAGGPEGIEFTESSVESGEVDIGKGSSKEKGPPCA